MRPGGVSVAGEAERGSTTFGPLFRYPSGTEQQKPYRIHRLIEHLTKERTEGRVGVVVGSGPSLREFDTRQLNSDQYVTFAVNDAAFVGGYQPNYWVVNDGNVLDKHRRKYLPPEVKIVTRRNNYYFQVKRYRNHNAEEPKFNCCMHRAYGYDAVSVADVDTLIRLQNTLYVRHTTATAAISLSAKLGLKRVVLVGVDLCFTDPNHYYHSGRKWLAQHDKNMEEKSERVGDVIRTKALDNMARQIEELQVGLRNVGLEIYQTNLNSPIDVQKMPWEKVPCLF